MPTTENNTKKGGDLIGKREKPEKKAALVYDWIDIMDFCLSTADVAKLTGREISSVRWARKDGRLNGLKINGNWMYNLFEVAMCFRASNRRGNYQRKINGQP